MRKQIAFLLAAFLLIPIGVVVADPVAREFYYQKKTTLAYPATYTLRFSLYDAEEGGNEVWFEEKPIKLGSNLIKTYLGDKEPLDPVDFSLQYWVQIDRKKKDGAYVQVGVREALGVVPYALYSPSGVPGGFYILGDTSIAPAGYTNTAYTLTFNGQSENWASKASIPTNRQGTNGVVSDGKIYVIAGFLGSPGLSANEEYDPTTNTWTTKASIPTGREGLVLAAVSNKIYVIGGTTDGSHGLSTNEEYDPATDTWTTKASIPTPTAFAAAAVVNNKIYVIVGTGENYEYDPATDTWTTKASIPTLRGQCAAASVDNKIYVIGGWTGSLPLLSINEEYDPSTDSWTAKANMPTARRNLSAVMVNGKIYAIGGNTSGGSGSQISTNEEYDPATDTWATKASMLTARDFPGAAAVNGKIYVIGGRPSGIVNEEYTPEIPEMIFYLHKKH